MQRTFGLKGVNKMSNIISYNSWENKAPFGAIKINQGVRISVQVNEGYDLLNLKWVILKEDKIVGEVDLIRESKKYYQGKITITALDKVNFSIDEGELVVILGPSGAGKTTLLNILGGIDTATSGTINVAGKNITKLNEHELTKYRRTDIGFVFQFYNLIQNLTALENVELAVQLCKDHLDPKEILTKVGLKNRLNNFPSELSGGEQQRVAIARSIAKNPKLLLADEPTGALDFKTGKQILKLLEDVCRKEKMTVIIITHNSILASMADKVIKINNGTVSNIIKNEHPKSIDELEW